MSVPKDKRTEGELAINTGARRICTYVLRITGNDKKFPKEQEWFTNLLREKAIGIDLNCWKANNIFVNSQTLYDKRMALEAEAGDACTEMLEIINIGRSLYHMSTNRYYKSLWAKGVNNGTDLQDGDDSQRTVRT